MHIDVAAIEEFRSRLRGDLLQPGDAGYDTTRKVWNEMVDKRPGDDRSLQRRGRRDRRRSIRASPRPDAGVRGGGHNVAGNAVCDHGLMLDCSGMKSVHVDPIKRIARAEPGVTWAEINHETQAFGLATTGGVVSHTGIAGLTLGGGLGWLAGKHGYTCDNLSRPTS